MSGRKAKRKKIAEVNTFPNVFQCFEFKKPILQNNQNEEVSYKGKWCNGFFGNNNALVLELACGKGDYTIALAKKYPTQNFVGVDIKGPRIHHGAKRALEDGINNVAFARLKIENILHFFGANEVTQIWITFPDPFPKDSHEKHRLTYKTFLEKYKQLLQPSGFIHLKTDDLDLARFSKQSVEEFGCKILYYKENIYATDLDFEDLNIQTFYEKQHLAKGRTINYLRFGF
jgi:tRNA (guanine-N7-)-methyltransferase